METREEIAHSFKPIFGSLEREASHRRRKVSEGQIGSGLATAFEVEVPGGTAYYQSLSDVLKAGNPRAKGPESFEEKGSLLKLASSSIDEHGNIKPIVVGNRKVVEVIMGLKVNEGKEESDTRFIVYNDPAEVNKRKKGRRILKYI